MPPKMFNCEICGSVVSKRKSIAITQSTPIIVDNDNEPRIISGRICKTHHEADKVSKERIEKEKRLREFNLKKKERKNELISPKRFHPHCSICKQNGIEYGEYLGKFFMVLDSIEEPPNEAFDKKKFIKKLNDVKESILNLDKYKDLKNSYLESH